MVLVTMFTASVLPYRQRRPTLTAPPFRRNRTHANVTFAYIHSPTSRHTEKATVLQASGFRFRRGGKVHYGLEGGLEHDGIVSRAAG